MLLCLPSTSWAANFIETPLEPNADIPWLGWLYSSNDGFGYNYGTDEDTLRTFGLHLGGVFLNRWLIALSLESFTDRQQTKELAKRIDQFKGLLGFQVWRLNKPDISVSLRTGLGTLFYGDWGSLGIQEGAHGQDPPPRPVPTAYDKDSFHAFGFLYGELYLPKHYVNVHLYAHLTHTLDANVDISLAYWVQKQMTQYKFTLGYKWNHVTHAGQAAQTVYTQETGLYLATKVMIGPFVFERGFNVQTLTQFSYAGLRFHNYKSHTNPTTHYRISYSLGFPIGHNSWIEYFRLHPFRGTSRVSFFLRTYHTENRIANQITNQLDDRKMRRIQVTSIGSELHFLEPDSPTFFNAFVFAGAGFSREMLTTHNQFEAQFFNLYTHPIVHVGMGVRIKCPDFIFKKKGRYIGVEMRVNYRYAFGDGFNYNNPNLLFSWGMIFSER